MEYRKADQATVRKWFRESMTARDEQRAASGLISQQNVQMQAAGVHPGVLSNMRRLASMREGQRGFNIYLTKLYLKWLEEELHDPTFETPQESSAVPFAQKRTAAA